MEKLVLVFLFLIANSTDAYADVCREFNDELNSRVKQISKDLKGRSEQDFLVRYLDFALKQGSQLNFTELDKLYNCIYPIRAKGGGMDLRNNGYTACAEQTQLPREGCLLANAFADGRTAPGAIAKICSEKPARASGNNGIPPKATDGSGSATR